MADTSVQRAVESWIRENWLPQKYRQAFRAKRLRLSAGGVFEFDAVSEDGSVVVTISTSGAYTATGKRGSGKLQKIRADALFLMMAQAAQPVLLFTEADMYNLCKKERENGRLPASLDFKLVSLPDHLSKRLQAARNVASREVSPRDSV